MKVRPAFLVALYVSLVLALWLQVPSAYESFKQTPTLAETEVNSSLPTNEWKPLMPAEIGSYLTWALSLAQEHGLQLDSVRYLQDVYAYELQFTGPEENILAFYEGFEAEKKARIGQALWRQAPEERSSLCLQVQAL